VLGIAVALCRGVHLAALLSGFGAALFRAAIVPVAGTEAGAGDAAIGRLLRASLVAALAVLALWFALEAATIADAGGLGAELGALMPVALATRFGHVVLARAALLIVALWLARRRGRSRWALAGLLAVAVASQAAIGHAAAATDNVVLALAVGLHVIAAGAWLGGLLPLILYLRGRDPAGAARAAVAFGTVGLIAVAVLAGSAVVQSIALIGGIGGWVGTAYGRLAFLKLGMFVLLLGIAAINRFRLIPAIARRPDGGGVAALRASIAAEAVIGLAIVLTAAGLASLPPAAHEQPVWPFAWRPSAAALGEPELRDELLGIPVGLAVALLLALLGWRRARWLVVPAALAVAAVALRPFDLFFVEAYPTSYARSPTGFSAAAIARGAALFPLHCAACHGEEGRGDGPLAARLSIPPADLTAPHLWDHAEGELYWWIARGMRDPVGGPAMPGFGSVLAEDDIWALIDFVRAQNVGAGTDGDGVLAAPVPAPAIDIACGAADWRGLEAFRGEAIRVAAVAATQPLSPFPDAATILLMREPDLVPEPDPVASSAPPCRAGGAAAWTAYAVIAGIPEGALDGTAFLIDRDGLLRATQPLDAPQSARAAPIALLARPAARSAIGVGHHH